MKRVNCYKCEGYYVTWEEGMPHGCRILGFKSKLMPSLSVFRSSGMPCQYFTEKANKKEKAP
ncbi:MAG: uracil-DNA glycosylase [Geovibrio sp.]|uniref:uracil-DNA glycosylase n=1 Tax=Geovibrio ferrireducens TaxID=46201 RepID=UPI002247BBAD|nr:uracil-DNA glycosylase [Geovibrio ferrireducens]MCD8493055.1 uracil-DNA glycosylase [Geovibrio sp.]MCD8568680.1 uracil-DNA glycosylase [Geovibrio sp.]